MQSAAFGSSFEDYDKAEGSFIKIVKHKSLGLIIAETTIDILSVVGRPEIVFLNPLGLQKVDDKTIKEFPHHVAIENYRFVPFAYPADTSRVNFSGDMLEAIFPAREDTADDYRRFSKFLISIHKRRQEEYQDALRETAAMEVLESGLPPGGKTSIIDLEGTEQGEL